MPGQGVGVEGAKRSKKAPKPPEIVKNGTKNRWFPILIDLKIVDMQFFHTQNQDIHNTYKMFYETWAEF
jgi:hypothetical protein